MNANHITVSVGGRATVTKPDGSPVRAIIGKPILIADGSEKPIENIQAGEAMLAWNEETKTAFSTTVIKGLHHEEKPQTLFDIELEDGRSFILVHNFGAGFRRK